MRSRILFALAGMAAMTACAKPAPAPSTPEPTPIKTDSEASLPTRIPLEAIDSMHHAAPAERATLEAVVYFELDSDRLTSDAEATLKEKVAALRTHPDIRIEIAGHTDERGSIEYNLALGMRRAQSVATFLESYGIAPNRFHLLSYGEEMPAAHAHDEQAWSQNRRAEFRILDGFSSVR